MIGIHDWYFCNFLSRFTLPLPLIRALVSSSVNTYSPKTAMQKPCLNSSESWVMFRRCLFSHLPVSNDLHRFEIMSILQKEETLVWVLAPHDSSLKCPLIADVLDILSYMANIRRNLLNWPLKGPPCLIPHIKRLNYWLGQWKQVHVIFVELSPPIDHESPVWGVSRTFVVRRLGPARHSNGHSGRSDYGYSRRESSTWIWEHISQRRGNVTIMNQILLWCITMMMTIKRITFKHINPFLKVNSDNRTAVLNPHSVSNECCDWWMDRLNPRVV